MVLRRRAALMGLVTSTALIASTLYFWRFGDDHGLVPFLLGCGLLLVAVVHGVAWRESRVPLLTFDMTGLMVRLGGGWVALPWNDVELVEITGRGRIGDGRVTVQPRDERRALAGSGQRSRVAALLNRWLYDASLVVPFGLTAKASVADIAGTVTRLADGRVPVSVASEEAAEPATTVEVSGAVALGRATIDAPPGVPPAAPTPPDEPALSAEPGPAGAGVVAPSSAPAAPRRLAAVVSALRFTGPRRTQASLPHPGLPTTVGALALAEPAVTEQTAQLPEVHELRRRSPEELEPGLDPAPPRSANVELVIDATADLSAGAMRGIRQRPSPLAPVPRDQGATAVAATPPATPESPAVPRQPAAVAIGDRLRHARERLGGSIDDLAERTRIRPYVIESIELGDFSPCGGDFYARGHLRMLSGVLGIDASPLLESYDEHLAGAPVSPRAVFDAELSTGLVRPAGHGSRWGALVGAVLVLLLVWGAAHLFADSSPDTSHPAGVPGSIGAVRPAAPDILDLQTPVPPPTRVRLQGSGGASRVVVWDRSMKVVFQGVLQDGRTTVVSGHGPLRVMAVDGGVVELATADHKPSVMGQRGERVFVHVG